MTITIETVRRFSTDADFEAIIGFLTRYRTRADLADDLGTSRWSLYAWERGQSIPRADMRAKLLDAVELRIARLPESEVPAEVLAQIGGTQ